MPTIHVSSDAATIGRIVEVLLTYGDRVQFHGDNNDRFDVTTEWDTPRAIGRQLVEDIESYQQERALERFTARREQWERDHQNFDTYVSVPCEFCHALAGDHCVTARGNKCERPYVHAARRRDAWRDEVRVEKLIPAAHWADYGDIDEIDNEARYAVELDEM